MQNRYAGDLGDYAKCGLLRSLCRDDWRLGMVWYLTDDESHNNDGKHRPPAVMRDCDPAMFDAFAKIGRRRSVATLQGIDAWPAHATFFDEPLTWRGVADRAAHRRAWLDRALAATRDGDVICVDPDNGLEVASVWRTAAKGPKYAFIDELQPFWRRGQSLVIYQHATRRGSTADQARQRIAQLCDGLGRKAAIDVMRFRRGSSRLFLIVSQPRHRRRITQRITAMLATPWSDHFEQVT